MTFPNYEFIKKGSSEIPEFRLGELLQTGPNASRPTKISKLKHYFGGFYASKLHKSFWMVNNITTSNFQKELEPQPHPPPRCLDIVPLPPPGSWVCSNRSGQIGLSLQTRPLHPSSKSASLQYMQQHKIIQYLQQTTIISLMPQYLQYCNRQVNPTSCPRRHPSS